MSEKELVILQLNDSHGYLELHPELFYDGGKEVYRNAGGYARIASVIKRERDEAGEDNVLALDCGDTFHGTYVPVRTHGEAMVPIMNEMAFDAMTAHWEFGHGPERFKELAGKLQYPVLAINCYEKRTGKLFFKPYTVVEAADTRIGIVGIASPIVDKVMPEPFSRGLFFTTGNKELPGYLETLQTGERAELIIVISHLGLPQDLQLAKEVSGIDVLLSAHTHNRLYEPILTGKTIVMQSGSHGSFVGRLALEIKNKRIASFDHELIEVGEDSVEADPIVGRMIDKVLYPYRDELSRAVGSVNTPLTRSMMLESTLDDLLMESVLASTCAELVFSNGWRFGAPILPGPVKVNDLYNIAPMNPRIETVEIRGDEIVSMLEENMEHTFSRDPYNQMGGYLKRCLGLKTQIKIENPPGHRIMGIYINGKKLEKSRSYRAAFVSSQGVPLGYGKNRADTGMTAVEAMEDHLSKGYSSVGVYGAYSVL